MLEYFSNMNWTLITNMLIAVAIWLQLLLVRRQVRPKILIHTHIELEVISDYGNRLNFVAANNSPVGVYCQGLLIQYATREGQSGWSQEFYTPARIIVKPFDVWDTRLQRKAFPDIVDPAVVLHGVEFRVRSIFFIRGKMRKLQWKYKLVDLRAAPIQFEKLRESPRLRLGQWPEKTRIAWRELRAKMKSL